MALASTDALASFDQAGNREDLSDVLSAVIARDMESTVNLIGGVSGEATATKHEWMESKLTAWTSSLAAALNTGATSVSVATGDGVKFRIGTLFRIANEPEVMMVTDISTDTLTVVRGYSSTSDPGTSYANGSTIQIISHPVQEGTDPINWEAIIRTRHYNICQIFYKTIKVTDTQQNVESAGVGSEIDWQTEQKVLEIGRELNINTIHGIRSETTGSDTAYRSFGGLIEYISASGGNSLDASGNALTTTRLTNLLEDIYDDGGFDGQGRLTVLAGATQKRAISGFLADQRRVDMAKQQVGTVVSSYETDFGVVDVMLERYMPDDAILVIDPSRVKLVALKASNLKSRDLPKTGLAYKKEIAGEFTLEVRNALEAHGYYYNLA